MTSRSGRTGEARQTETSRSAAFLRDFHAIFDFYDLICTYIHTYIHRVRKLRACTYTLYMYAMTYDLRVGAWTGGPGSNCTGLAREMERIDASLMLLCLYNFLLLTFVFGRLVSLWILLDKLPTFGNSSCSLLGVWLS